MSNLDPTDTMMTRIAPDGRADGGTRRVSITASCISIDRAVKGVKMRLSVPVSRYGSVILTCRHEAGHPLYRVVLAHRDADLSIEMEAAYDASEASRRLRYWAAFFSKPGLVEGASAPAAAARRRRGPPRARRAPGHRDRMSTVFRGEREIVSYE